jgi:hypothetical protein
VIGKYLLMVDLSCGANRAIPEESNASLGIQIPGATMAQVEGPTMQYFLKIY